MIRKILFFFAACGLLAVLQACDNGSSSTSSFCRIIYQATNADAGVPPADGLFRPGSMAKVDGNPGGMRRGGAAAGSAWIFTGWADSAKKKYSVGTRFPINADLVLYAQWKQISTNALAGKKTFWTQDFNDDSWYTVNAVKIADDGKCIVYADEYAFLTIEESWGKIIADRYNEPTNGVYDKITGVFNNTDPLKETIEDVDDNDQVIFLLLDIQDGYAGSGGYVAGYFHSYHMYQRSPSFPYSNGADMLFMDINPGLPNPDPAKSKTFYSTMAHELQHLINWSIRLGKETGTETWLDEGLSTAAEFVYGGEDINRIDYFNKDLLGTIAYGNNFFCWDKNGDTWESDVLADYATAYLFFRWLGIHGGGNSIYTDIINSSFSNYQAVTGAAGSIPTDIDPGASTSEQKKWAALLSGWMRANMIGNSETAFGYKGGVTGTTTQENSTGRPKARYFNTAQPPIFLYPGEGVFSPWSSGDFEETGNIKYISNIPIGTSDNKVLLTYNGNTSINGGKEPGFPAANTTEAGGRSAASGGMAVSGGGEEITLPASYPVGFRDLPGERARARGRSAGAGLKK